MLRLALSVFLYSGLVSATARDFSLYPTASQSCLYAAADASACDTSTVPKFNTCVCSNGGGFLDSAASCLGKEDSSKVGSVYSTMSRNCGDSGTPIAFTLAKWNAAAGSGSPASSSSASIKSITSIVTSVSTAKTPPSTVVQTVVAPTTIGTSAVVITVTQAAASGQTSAVLSFVTLTSGQTTQIPFVTYTSVSGTGTGTETAASQTSTGTSTSTAVPSSGSEPDTGVILGIAVGIAVIFALLGLVLFLFLRNRKNRADSSAGAAVAPPLTGPSGPPPEQLAAPSEKYYQQPAVHQVHQYPSPAPSPAPMYSEHAKYNTASSSSTASISGIKQPISCVDEFSATAGALCYTSSTRWCGGISREARSTGVGT